VRRAGRGERHGAGGAVCDPNPQSDDTLQNPCSVFQVLQSLLGNMGRPGGGIMALRGHASIQGSTDIPTLFDLLPGYLVMPHAHGNEDLDTYIGAEKLGGGFWANTRQYMVSLLKAWWGDAATRFGVFFAGVRSARDPRYTVVPQRERLREKAASHPVSPLEESPSPAP
jgi:hypothetical protein